MLYDAGIPAVILSNTVCKSVFKSSTASKPTDKRIKSCVTPVDACCAAVNCWCVVLAG
jgi:hypothetical protein